MYPSHGNAKLYLRNRLTSTIVFSEIKFWIIRGAANGMGGEKISDWIKAVENLAEVGVCEPQSAYSSGMQRALQQE